MNNHLMLANSLAAMLVKASDAPDQDVNTQSSEAVSSFTVTTPMGKFEITVEELDE